MAEARVTLAKVFAIAGATILAGQPAARADWGFTHWGMTPAQVVGASGDDVSKLCNSLITRYRRPIKDSASSSFEDLTWHEPDDLELAINLKPLTAAVTHCAPGRNV